MDFAYKRNNPDPKQRRINNLKVLEKNPGRVPIVFEKKPGSCLAQPARSLFFLDRNIRANEIAFILRGIINAPRETPIYFLINGEIPFYDSKRICEIYDKYKDAEDGILYMAFTEQSPPIKINTDYVLFAIVLIFVCYLLSKLKIYI